MRSKTFIASIAPLLLSSGALLTAQGALVSPQPASATVEGIQSNTFPVVSNNFICRYMQVHSDVLGAPRLIRQIAFRRNGPSTPQVGSRAVDMDMQMFLSVDWDQISLVFARNYRSAPMLVFTRQVLNLSSAGAPGNPAPFELQVPLTTPFPYPGALSLGLEMVQYSNVANGYTTSVDAEGGSSSVAALPTLTGSGCTATGQTFPMDLGVQHVDRGAGYYFGAFVKYGPINAPTVVFIGASNPSLVVPGLCSLVHTDLLLQVPVGLTDASGYLGERANSATVDYPSALCAFVVPNTFAGGALYAQAHSLDIGRTDPIRISNSNGRSWIVPTPNTTVVAKASRLYNFQLQGPTYPHATPLTLTQGYAAVTEFSY